MAATVSEERSATMRAVKSKGNKSTEVALSNLLREIGIHRWSSHNKRLPGSPDFSFRKKKVAIFVDGCFWHGCPKCYRGPKTSRQYWGRKVQMNIARDHRNKRELQKLGWRVIRIWEHQFKKNPLRLKKSLLQKLI